jgi:hypothetical protein
MQSPIDIFTGMMKQCRKLAAGLDNDERKHVAIPG